jgi:ABC-2 type transport system ATP-binding protein
VDQLVKRYGQSPDPVVDRLSFSVRTGECFGLLGPNGAGKSTTIGVLTTRVLPTSGSVIVGGIDVVANPVGARSVLGVVSQRNNLDLSLNIRQNLIYHGAYHGLGAVERVRRADELLEQFALGDRPTAKAMQLSGGQVQRVMIARALMHRPQVLFLDEPSTGLDPAARLFVWDRIRELRAAGITVVLTTHDMDEAAALTDRVGIIDHGKLLALDTPAKLIQRLPHDRTAVSLTLEHPQPALFERLGAHPSVQHIDPIDPVNPTILKVRLAQGTVAPIAALADIVEEAGNEVRGVQTAEASLEDVFIQLTGRSLR